MENNSRLIGVVSDAFTHSFTVRLLDEVNRQLNARGYAAVLIDSSACDSALEVLPLLGGLLLLSGQMNKTLYAAAEALPVVHLGEALQRGNDIAGEEIARLLLSQGHQRFGYMQIDDNSTLLLTGFTRMLACADKPLNAVLTAGSSNEREYAYRAMMAYLKQARSSERINALLCENDLLAFGALQAVRDFGQGAHVAVVGCGDIDEAAASTWHLTTWAQRYARQAEEAINRLFNPNLNRNDTDNPGGELRVRHSHLAKSVPGEMAQCGCAIRH